MRAATAMHAEPDDTSGFAKTNRLTLELLDMLFSGQILALIITEAIDRRTVDHLTRRITGSSLTPYGVEPRFLKAGRAWFDNGTAAEREAHIAATFEYTARTRALCAPFPVPTDTLKLDLDLLWPSGAINQRIGGRAIYYGLPRSLPPGGAVDPHYDWIGHDSPEAPGIERIQKQIGVNFYLQPAEAGGDLALWRTGKSPAELAAIRDPKHAYALDEAKLGPPDLIVRPEPRSLVLFEASQPHAVRRAVGNLPRVSFSAFLGFQGRNLPLTLWS